MHSNFSLVMAGLVPAIYAFRAARKGVDARDKRERDGESIGDDSAVRLLAPARIAALLGIEP